MTTNKVTSRPIFLTVEGIEGVGKSTAVQYIQDFFKDAQIEYVATREPGGTIIAEEIRRILLKPISEENILPETEILLMFACRIQHIAHIIEPTLAKGKSVICDRFVDASFAYQGYGRGIDLSKIKMLEEWLLKKIRPDLTILLDAPAELGLQRAKHRGPHDRIEAEKLDFHERVRDGYLKRAIEDQKRFRIIDASQSLEKVKQDLNQILQTLINPPF